MQLGQPVAACLKDVPSCLGAGQTVLAFFITPSIGAAWAPCQSLCSYGLRFSSGEEL